MKKYIFIRNKVKGPSCYYRILQFLDTDNYEIIEYDSKISNNIHLKNKFLNNVFIRFIPGYYLRIKNIIKIILKKIIYKEQYFIFIQREVFPKYVGILGETLLKVMNRNAQEVIWDFDDNIFKEEISTKEAKILFDTSSKIIVGNKFLKNYIINRTNSSIEVINTTDKMFENLDLDKITLKRCEEYDHVLNIVWVGTKHNFRYLEPVIKYIDLAAEKINFKNVILKIICDKELVIKTNKLLIRNIPWSRERVKKELENSHIGIMPLIENEFTKGKCAFKAVQYISAGIPILVSNVGMNNEVVLNNYNGYLLDNYKEWEEAILKLSNDKEKWINFSYKSRDLWKKNFDSKNIEKIIKNILKE